jgi:hypothetical protein
MQTRPHPCTLARRIGPVRAAAFGATAAGLPLAIHGSSGATSAIAWLALAASFAAWSWHGSCRRARSSLQLASVIVAAQGLVHLVYAGTAAMGDATAVAAHAHHATGGMDVGTTLAMVAVHLLAAASGASLLAALDRRALAAVARAVRTGRTTLARWLRAIRKPEVRDCAHACFTFVVAGLHARARRLRARSRAHARRGPPRVPELLPAT